jgi:hypothetical protein
MSPAQVLVITVVMAAFGIAGSLIGRRKGFPVWGFFMGAILGVIGLVILACWRPDRKALVRREAARLAVTREAQALIDGKAPLP